MHHERVADVAVHESHLGGVDEKAENFSEMFVAGVDLIGRT